MNSLNMMIREPPLAEGLPLPAVAVDEYDLDVFLREEFSLTTSEEYRLVAGGPPPSIGERTVSETIDDLTDMLFGGGGEEEDPGPAPPLPASVSAVALPSLAPRPQPMALPAPSASSAPSPLASQLRLVLPPPPPPPPPSPPQAPPMARPGRPRFLAPRLEPLSPGPSSVVVAVAPPPPRAPLADADADADADVVMAEDTPEAVVMVAVEPGPRDDEVDPASLPDAIRARYSSAKEYRKHVAIPRYLRKRKNRDWKKASAPLYPSRTAAASRRKRENGQFMEHKTEWVSVADASSRRSKKKKARQV